MGTAPVTERDAGSHRPRNDVRAPPRAGRELVERRIGVDALHAATRHLPTHVLNLTGARATGLDPCATGGIILIILALYVGRIGLGVVVGVQRLGHKRDGDPVGRAVRGECVRCVGSQLGMLVGAVVAVTV